MFYVHRASGEVCQTEKERVSDGGGAAHPCAAMWCPAPPSLFPAWDLLSRPAAALLSSSSYSLTSFTSFTFSTLTMKITMNYARRGRNKGNGAEATVLLRVSGWMNCDYWFALSSPGTSRYSWAAVQKGERWRRSRRGWWGQSGCWTHRWHTALWEETSRDGTRTWERWREANTETQLMCILFHELCLKTDAITTKHLTLPKNKYNILLKLTMWCWSWQSPSWRARRWAGSNLLPWSSGRCWACWTPAGCHWRHGETAPGSPHYGIWRSRGSFK